MENTWEEETQQWAHDFMLARHSVTRFRNHVYCIGVYGRRRDHYTLVIYSVKERMWIRPPDTLLYAYDDRILKLHEAARITVSGAYPNARRGHTATLVVEPHYNPQKRRARIFIIGGYSGKRKDQAFANDCQILEISGCGQRLHWVEATVKGNPPIDCNLHTADYVISRQEIYVFQGGHGICGTNEMYALYVETLTWRLVPTTGAVPEHREDHGSCMLDKTEEVVIFNGKSFGGMLRNDVHILDIALSNWTSVRMGGILQQPMGLLIQFPKVFAFGELHISSPTISAQMLNDAEPCVDEDPSTSSSLPTLTNEKSEIETTLLLHGKDHTARFNHLEAILVQSFVLTHVLSRVRELAWGLVSPVQRSIKSMSVANHCLIRARERTSRKDRQDQIQQATLYIEEA